MNNLRRLCSSKACPDLLASLRPGVAASYSSAVEGSLPSAATERATRVVELDVKDELHAEKVRRVLEQPVHPAASPFEASPSETKVRTSPVSSY